jgi:TonB family protein
MKPTLSIIMAMTLAALYIGCGENSKGPDPQITPPTSADGVSQEAPPPDQLAVDKEPAVVKTVAPVYPELAKRSGLEGRVFVKIWVDTEGKPKQVTILKSDAEIFNQPTIDAAKQFLFTPAYIKDKPVDVWVSLPFKYRLAEKKSNEQGSETKLQPPTTEEKSFMGGYIAAKEESLAALEKEIASVPRGGKEYSALQQKLEKSKGELQALKEALRAMREGK